MDPAAGGRLGLELDEDHLAADGRILQLEDSDHLHELVELLGDLLDHVAALGRAHLQVIRESSGRSVGPTASD